MKLRPSCYSADISFRPSGLGCFAEPCCAFHPVDDLQAMNVVKVAIRPCFFPVSVIDQKGKVKKTYPYEEVMTPYEKLKSLPEAESCLRPGVTLESLGDIANQMSDNEFAERMVKARSDLFQQISRFAKRVA